MFNYSLEMLGVPNTMCCGIATLMLCACAITDLKKREIYPVLVLVCAGAAVTGSLLFYGTYPLHGFIGGLIGFIPYLFLAWKGKCGGGDALLMFAAGLCLGVFAVSLLMLITTALFFGYAVVLSKRIQKDESKDKQYPYAPFVFAAWILLSASGFFILYL